MTVADDSDLVRGKSELLVSGIQNHIIVPERVVLVESHLIEVRLAPPYENILETALYMNLSGARSGGIAPSEVRQIPLWLS